MRSGSRPRSRATVRLASKPATSTVRAPLSASSVIGVRVEQGDRPGLGQTPGQTADGVGGERMGQRLVEHVAALQGVKGFNVEH
jgi:hypothetical protein